MVRSALGGTDRSRSVWGCVRSRSTPPSPIGSGASGASSLLQPSALTSPSAVPMAKRPPSASSASTVTATLYFAAGGGSGRNSSVVGSCVSAFLGVTSSSLAAPPLTVSTSLSVVMPPTFTAAVGRTVSWMSAEATQSGAQPVDSSHKISARIYGGAYTITAP